MGFLKGILNFLSKLEPKPEKEKFVNKPNLYTEEEILKAMDQLPDPPMPPKGYSKGELTHKIPKVGLWSSFEYLNESPYGSDEGLVTPFFVVPCGWEYDTSVKMWYLGIHYNETIDKVYEFCTEYDYKQVKEEATDY